MLSAVGAAVLTISGVAQLGAVLLLVVDLRRDRLRPGAVVTDPVACVAIGVLAAVAVGLQPAVVLPIGAVAAAAGVLLAWRTTDFWPSGVTAWAALLVSVAGGAVVVGNVVLGLEISLFTRALIMIGLVVGAVRVPSILMQTYEATEVALRRRWHHSRRPATGWTPPADAPFVTIQVPTYAEPPEIVIGTLDALSRLDYPAFEVLVIDNNTRDERLWRPVQEHCDRLGPRFRFLHVEGITGAKAGALNWARPEVDRRTELVALVDADYQVDARWLADTVPLFADRELGFVQCPHAYRDYRQSRPARMVNAGYEWAQATEMVSRNEHDAGITVGTMSLIRLAALDVAGGWAEWCQTEDSEFAIRVHAAGYRSILLDRAYGRGLIPETMTELKKQRFRWTYGPGQEFKQHRRLYLPRLLGGRPSALSLRQRIRHGHYGLLVLMTGLTVFDLPFIVLLAGSLAVHREAPTFDPLLLIPVGSALLAAQVLRWLIYRRFIGAGLGAFVGGTVALAAVQPTLATAAFCVLAGRPAVWQRTNKFRTVPGRLRWLAETRTEVIFGVGCVLASVATPLLLPYGPLTLLLAACFAGHAVTYAASALLAWLAQRDLRRSTLPTGPDRSEVSRSSPGSEGRPGRRSP